jgi:hypothetical protein
MGVTFKMISSINVIGNQNFSLSIYVGPNTQIRSFDIIYIVIPKATGDSNNISIAYSI